MTKSLERGEMEKSVKKDDVKELFRMKNGKDRKPRKGEIEEQKAYMNVQE